MMKYKSNTILLTIFVAVISSASVVQSLYDFKDGGAIQELTDANFNDKVFDSQQMWVVEFYAPWCGHCKELAPKFDRAAEILRVNESPVVLAKVDATDPAMEKTMQDVQVQGYPTLQFFRDGKFS